MAPKSRTRSPSWNVRAAEVFLRMIRSATVSLGLLAILAPTLASSQVSWSSLSFDEALAQATRESRLVVVDVYSDHCGQCGQLETEIWSGEDGPAVVEGLIPLKIEATTAEGQAFTRRYPILGVPAVILFEADGSEVDRVVGYFARNQFLDAMAMLRSGVDPVPELEAAVETDPNPAIMLELLEKYLHRKRERDAVLLLERILQADPDNSAQQSEKAIGSMAKYASNFLLDPAKSDSYWRRLATLFPDASSIGAATKETFDYAQSRGELNAWVAWACEINSAHPEAGKFAYNVATFANRNQLRGSCLADAARTAKRLGIGPAWMDSIATVLEGN